MPAIIRMPHQSNNGGYNHGGNNGGIEICCCRICTCINLGFITTKHGLLKLCEFILGSFCETLLFKFGFPAANDIGQAFHSFSTATAACLTTVSILMCCYLISTKTFNLVRQSLFEVAFNAVACFLYLSASSYMGFAVTVYLYPRFVIQPAYMVYPAMTGVYYIGVVVGIIHGVDAYTAYQCYRGIR